MAQTTSQPAVNAPIQPPPDFPVTWEDPADEGRLWVIDLMHYPEPLPLLSFSRSCDVMAGFNEVSRLFESPTHILTRRRSCARRPCGSA
jgi:hypothetical protein